MLTCCFRWAGAENFVYCSLQCWQQLKDNNIWIIMLTSKMWLTLSHLSSKNSRWNHYSWCGIEWTCRMWEIHTVNTHPHTVLYKTHNVPNDKAYVCIRISLAEMRTQSIVQLHREMYKTTPEKGTLPLTKKLHAVPRVSALACIAISLIALNDCMCMLYQCQSQQP